jgi:hypothetical protein
VWGAAVALHKGSTVFKGVSLGAPLLINHKGVQAHPGKSSNQAMRTRACLKLQPALSSNFNSTLQEKDLPPPRRKRQRTPNLVNDAGRRRHRARKAKIRLFVFTPWTLNTQRVLVKNRKRGAEGHAYMYTKGWETLHRVVLPSYLSHQQSPKHQPRPSSTTYPSRIQNVEYDAPIHLEIIIPPQH